MKKTRHQTIKRQNKRRLAIYTVLVGQKEILNDPLPLIDITVSTDLSFDFFCFTDNDSLISPTWRFRQFNHRLLPPEKASRLPKARPDLFFPDYDYSLYIDNTVVFKRLPTRSEVEGSLLRGFRHPWRKNPLDEADIVAKSSLDDPDVVAAQIAFYARCHPLETIDTLTTGTVLLRRHHDSRVRRFGEFWWEQILLFSKRDQICLDLCAREAGCPVKHFDGDKLNNDLFFWPVVNGRRVLGSFDADRYAWVHRHDPVAHSQPRSHFLAHGGNDDKFDRHESWFRYACLRTGCSLGDAAPPRRGLADIVGRQLAWLEGNLEPILFIGISSDESSAAEPEELDSARAAIHQYFRFSNQPEVITAMASEQDMLDDAPFQAAAGKNGFQLVVVLGLPIHCHSNALAKFLPLLVKGGRLLVEFGDSLSIDEITRMHGIIGNQGALEIFHGRHITREDVIPSSVFVLDSARS